MTVPRSSILKNFGFAAILLACKRSAFHGSKNLVHGWKHLVPGPWFWQICGPCQWYDWCKIIHKGNPKVNISIPIDIKGLMTFTQYGYILRFFFCVRRVSQPAQLENSRFSDNVHSLCCTTAHQWLHSACCNQWIMWILWEPRRVQEAGGLLRGYRNGGFLMGVSPTI